MNVRGPCVMLSGLKSLNININYIAEFIFSIIKSELLSSQFSTTDSLTSLSSHIDYLPREQYLFATGYPHGSKRCIFRSSLVLSSILEGVQMATELDSDTGATLVHCMLEI